MAERGANIDLIFRNGLKDYEVLPPSEVWDAIQPVLKKKNRPVIFFRIAASVAAVITLGAISLILVNRLPSDISAPTVSLYQEITPAVINIPAINNPAVPLSDKDYIASNKPADEPDGQLGLPVTKFTLPEPHLYTSFLNDNSVQSGRAGGMGSTQSNPLPDGGSPSGRNNVNQADLISTEKPVTLKGTRWSVGAMVTPTYYSNVNLSTDDAAKEMVKSEEAAMSYSGGFSLGYKISRRLSVQSGIYYSSVGQKITGVNSYSGFGQYHNSKGSGLFSVITSSGTIVTGNNNIYLSDNNTGTRVITAYTADVFDPEKANLEYLNSSLHQDFNYLEIPFLLKYKLFDRNIDFNISGGISYNRLLSNSAYAFSSGERIDVGETVGLSTVAFSSSLGMGLEYSFSKRLSLNLEPTFRYYITPIGGVAGSVIHPYSFGVLSGVSYRF